ncbi:hypothetical protein SPI_04132 [Niveomyces insectorum RCEF 264]|uniref:Uncharacterized protein n=1 Tax=Niveomyces insectorum RCEF 264 TaxID=1081102 RepID=A0A162J1V3_9HYPO|nr:hypothetical protein SPI_04132 [Niveomyces insectorum RCEF 264]
MPTSSENVAALYGKIAARESTRLATHAMEREITLRTIHKLLRSNETTGSSSSSSSSSSPPKRIADIGGGPGKVAFALADAGHHTRSTSRATEGILGGGLDAQLEAAGPEVIQAGADLLFAQYYSVEEAYLGGADHLLAVLRRK